MIYFDLDGVLRDLHDFINWTPKTWEEPIEGMHIVNYFAKNQKLLRIAPATLYLEMALSNFDKVNIITACHESWKTSTIYWITKYIPRRKLGELHFTEHLQKLHLLKDNDILIEDCPRYTDYSQVILIDRSYNRDLELPHVRVNSPNELMSEITRRLK